ncbi:MAG TPA: aryl-sulfate sulfohydrolase [Rhodopirellula sp.]|nr:MAG: aryl-sulfate sulfohydrolase [Saprospirales bacterium TMED214]HBV65985.1 aryl-sulfate sulfohydrolase [Rhodopirellula sp.]
MHPLKLRLCLQLTITLTVLSEPAQLIAQEQKSENLNRPNVLFIFLDDYGWRDCGFMGSDYYETPNLDALAKSGMIFTNAYSASANCAPARACLLSGQYTPRHEIYNVGTSRRGNPKFGKWMHVPGTDTLPEGIRTWAQQIQTAGYRTGTIGKWHLSDDPLPYGFDFNFAGTHSGSPPRGYYPPHPKAPGLKNAPSDEYLTDRLTDEAIGFIDRNRKQPWFLYLTHFAVHTPLQGKSDLVAKYEAKPKGQLHSHAVMAAMIESVDTGVGRIMDKLEETGLKENTVIFFSSDNGGYGPATSMTPLKGYKGTYYEGGIREPMFVTWPGVIAAGSQSDEPVINVDFYPTFCEITKAELPEGQPRDGESLLPILLQDKATLKDRALFWHFPAYLQSYQRVDGQRDLLYRSRPCSIIRDGRWKLHQYFEDDAIELYDLKNDISESHDLSSSNPEKASELLLQLRTWQREINAPIPAERNPLYDPAAEAEALHNMQRKQSKKK